MEAQLQVVVVVLHALTAVAIVLNTSQSPHIPQQLLHSHSLPAAQPHVDALNVPNAPPFPPPPHAVVTPGRRSSNSCQRRASPFACLQLLQLCR
jgi:hypothetical protein